MSTRKPIAWHTAVAIIAGMSLIGWAVDDSLSWLQRAALVFGVVLTAYGVASSRAR